MVSIHRFRWAELQLAIFLDENSPFRLPEDVISKLDRLDEEVGLPDLDLVYNEIYQKNTRAGTRDRENVMRTFTFMLYSFIDWEIDGLADAIALGLDGKLNLTIDASYVLDICSNFLVVDRFSHVQFAHLSVPEYLKGDRSAIVFSDMDAHAQIAEVCLSYVMSPSAQEIVKKREFDRRQVIHQKEPNRQVLYKKEPNWKRIAIQRAHPYYSGTWLDDPLSLHMYAFALCLEHCELASMDKRQEGTALCSLLTNFMSVGEINPAFLRFFPELPRNWTTQKSFAHYRTRRRPTRADAHDSFFAACAYGFTEILQDMMRSGVNVDVNRRNKEGAPAICVAIKRGQFSVVELLLDKGAHVDIRDNRYGLTPLYQAAVWGHPNMVDLLLSRGADASARFTACYADKCKGCLGAPRNDSTDATLIIIEESISARSSNPVYSSTDREDDEDDEADVHVGICQADETLLHFIARGEYEWSHVRLNWGREFGKWGGGPMYESKMSSMVGSLLKHGASIEAIDSRLRTPLHLAALQPDGSIAVSILLHHGASPGALDEECYTPLMRSATTGPTATLELLLKKASIADIVRRNNEAHSVLSLSIKHALDKTVHLLNTVDLRAARELGTQEGDEFVELSDIIKRISVDIPIHAAEPSSGLDGFGLVPSQRSVINCLQAIGKKIVMGVDGDDADLRDKLRKEGFNFP